MVKKKSSFRSKVNKDAQRQKRQASSYGYLQLPKGVNIFKEEPGRTKLDILPYKVTDKNHPDRDEENGIAITNELWYKRPFWKHNNIGADNDTVVCLKSIGKTCPICSYRKERISKGADQEETKALKASLRNLYVVIPVGHKKLDEVPHIWDISQFLFQNMLNEEIEEDDDNSVFPDLEEGLTLKLRFAEASIGKNKFAEVSRIDFVEREEAYDESILEDVPDLDKVLKILTPDELKAKFFEMEEEDVADEDDAIDDGDEEEEEERKPRKKKSLKKKPKEEEEDEDEDEEKDTEDDEDEEEEKKPKRRSKRKKAKEDEEDDEEKEEKPKRSKSKDKCPHGHKFGIDIEKYDDCKDCEIWEDCDEEAN